MRKFLSFLMIFVLIGGMANAQNVALVIDDNVADDYTVIETALTAGASTYSTFDLATLDTLLYSDISSYDLVLWYTGSDRVGLHLFDTITTPSTIQFYPALKEYYNNQSGVIWIDGIDFVKSMVIQTDGSANDNVPETTPVSFPAGHFFHDVLGLQSWDYESKTDGDDGVPQLDKANGNAITSLDPIRWQYSTLWRGDGWTPVSGVTKLYEMGPSSFAGAGYTSFYKYVNNGVTMYVSSVRLAKIGDGSVFSQANLNSLVADIVSEDAAVENLKNTVSIKLYPNPVTEYATISLSENNKASQITIFDITGKTVYSQSVKAGQDATINTSNFASGIYTVSILSDNKISTTKMSVVK